MKRNKLSARAMRNGTSPYRRQDKRPCPTCQVITRHDREAALCGESRYQEPMEEPNGTRR